MLFRLALQLLYNKTTGLSETPPGIGTVHGFIPDYPAMGIRLGEGGRRKQGFMRRDNGKKKDRTVEQSHEYDFFLAPDEEKVDEVAVEGGSEKKMKGTERNKSRVFFLSKTGD